MWWQRQKQIQWQTGLSVEECIQRIREETDVGVRTIFSFSGYKGKRKVLSSINGSDFRLWKRRYYRNDFAPVFIGSLKLGDSGSRIEGAFDLPRLAKNFMFIWLALVALIGLPQVFLSHGQDAMHAAGIIGTMLVFGMLLPEFGRLIGKGEERYLREFVESTLAAHRVDTGTAISTSVIENKPLG